MNASKLMWSWFDGDDVYVNEAQSLVDIIEEIIEYYYDDATSVRIEKKEECYEVFFFDQELENTYHFDVGLKCEDVEKFLERLAEDQGRPDKFSIVATS
jgi:hypothetical protein